MSETTIETIFKLPDISNGTVSSEGESWCFSRAKLATLSSGRQWTLNGWSETKRPDSVFIRPEGKGNVIERCKVKPGENVPAMRSCVCVSVSVWDAMNSLGYNEQQARNSKAAYDVMGNCEWLLDRVRESSEMFWKTLCPWQGYQHGSKLDHLQHLFKEIFWPIYFHDFWSWKLFRFRL